MMRRATVIAASFWAAQFSGAAVADLYRWVDPETGSVKFSSYPPPWYGDEAQERRAPKVEHIPPRDAPREAPGSEARDGPLKPVAERKPAAEVVDGVPDKPAAKR